MSDSMNERASVLQYFLETWRELFLDLPDSYSCHMNCTEANAIAELYEAFGEPRTAKAILAAHAEHDEEGDQHWLHQGG
jgi:hypothetical protein